MQKKWNWISFCVLKLALNWKKWINLFWINVIKVVYCVYTHDCAKLCAHLNYSCVTRIQTFIFVFCSLKLKNDFRAIHTSLERPQQNADISMQCNTARCSIFFVNNSFQYTMTVVLFFPLPFFLHPRKPSFRKYVFIRHAAPNI